MVILVTESFFFLDFFFWVFLEVFSEDCVSAVSDSEGFVSKIKKSNLTDKYTVITKKEWEELSGEKYYKETFGHGGKRKGAGRKPKTGVVLEFQVRLSAKEKEFINYARNHHLNYDELMQG